MGFFGLLGSGNLGNDGSFEAVLMRLRSNHPETVVDAMCMGSERMSSRIRHPRHPTALVRGRTGSHGNWRREGRLGTRKGDRCLANVLVGTTTRPRGCRRCRRARELPPHAGHRRALRHIPPVRLRQDRGDQGRPAVGRGHPNHAASDPMVAKRCRALAYYRSYRDTVSWDVMQQSGTFAAHDPVYTDLVFSLPAPPADIGDPRLVGVGIMEFFGGTDDRRDGQHIHERYIDAMTQFVCWLVDHGYGVRFLPGDESHGRRRHLPPSWRTF